MTAWDPAAIHSQAGRTDQRFGERLLRPMAHGKDRRGGQGVAFTV